MSGSCRSAPGDRRSVPSVTARISVARKRNEDEEAGEGEEAGRRNPRAKLRKEKGWQRRGPSPEEGVVDADNGGEAHRPDAPPPGSPTTPAARQTKIEATVYTHGSRTRGRMAQGGEEWGDRRLAKRWFTT